MSENGRFYTHKVCCAALLTDLKAPISFMATSYAITRPCSKLEVIMSHLAAAKRPHMEAGGKFVSSFAEVDGVGGAAAQSAALDDEGRARPGGASRRVESRAAPAPLLASFEPHLSAAGAAATSQLMRPSFRSCYRDPARARRGFRPTGGKGLFRRHGQPAGEEKVDGRNPWCRAQALPRSAAA